ncbi:amino acid adenylation domain-containing protein [Nocardia sp. NPDC057353]|uniref:amino acid adenylation domain-containing protein n=1 Tax=Nocardia sp. NPDC057353 TaxID=3346104 RepID=UPI003639F122
MTTRPQATLPLTSAQREVWFAQQLLGSLPLTITQYVDVHGPLDRAAYARAARHTAREFGSYLRFGRDADGTPWQRLDYEQYDEVDFHDFGAAPDPFAAALAWMRADQRRPLDITAEEASWSSILRLGPERHLVYTRVHHLVLDGFGAMTVARRHAELYGVLVAGGALPEPEPGSPQVLLDADRSYRESARFRTDRKYWTEHATGLPEPVSLANRPGELAPWSVVVGADLDPERVAALAAAGAGAGSAAVLIGAFAGYLGRSTGGAEVSLSLPVTGRTTAVLRKAAGLVSNVVPLRIAVPDSATTADLVAAVRAEVGGALRHQRYRGEDIERDRGTVGTGFGPAVNIMNFHSTVELGQARGTLHLLTTGPVPDLTLNIYPGSADGLRVEFEGNPNRYTEPELGAHHARFLRLLAHLTDDPAATLGGFDPLDAAERAALVPWRGPAAVQARPLAEIIAAAVRRAPERTAVVHEERRWSYPEFDARTDRIARELIAAGVGPETRVVTLLERSAESVAAVWAVTKAGGAFVPVDPGYPEERIAYVLADSQAALALTTAEHADRLPAQMPRILLDGALDRDEWPGAPAADSGQRSGALAGGPEPRSGAHTADSGLPGAPPEAGGARAVAGADPGPITDAERTAALRPEHPAYLIYTSGSTGRPKGVVVTHGGLANLAAERHDRYALRPGAIALHHASPGFDMAVGEQLCALAGGATLVVASRFTVAGPDLAALLRRERVSNAIITPAVLATLDPAELPDLKVLGVGGEAIRADLVNAWAPGRAMRNGYGPTEATDIATIGELVEGRPVTIGAPLRGFHALVLDAALRPVPPGVLGELYIGGPALARGYHGRPALTAGRFVADPYGPPGGRLYRTGDLVTVTDLDGEPALLYHGRSDFQIKVRGHRIEPGEVETALTALPGIGRAAVTAHTDPRTGTHLVAYLVPAAGERIELAAVRAELARALPAYLRPAAYVILESLPLTTNGKLDARRLPAPTFGRAEFRAPAGPAEQRVAEVFAEVFETERRIGADDDFFALGGTSLSATRVAARLRVPVRAVFDTPTVAGLAPLLGTDSGGQEPVAGERPEVIPPAPAQLRLWLLNQLLPDSAAYHLPVAVRLDGPLAPPALAAAVRAVLTRHEVLRTVYPESGSGARQQVLPVSAVLAGLDLEPRAAAGDLQAELTALAAEPFDVAVDPPVRLRLFRIAPEQHVLALVAHHIAADGWSLGPLVADLTAAYAAAHAGERVELPALPLQYADYTLWQLERLGDPADPDSRAAKQLDYWRAELTDVPDSLPLPTRVAEERAGDGAAVEIPLDVPAGGIADGTPFMIAFAAYAVLLHRLSGKDDLVIGTPVAGRGHPALDALVGMFVNTVPLRTRIDPAATFGELVAAVRATALDAFEQADVPFDRIVQAVHAPRLDGGHPLLRTVFSYENLPAPPPLGLAGLRVEVLEVPQPTAQFDLTLTVRENPPRAVFRYDTAVFDRDSVEGFAEGYRAVLAAALVDPAAPVGVLAEAGGEAVADPATARSAHAARAAREVAPMTAREQAIAAVFAEVLELDEVGPEDDFFELGGTSLLVFTLRTALADRLGLRVAPRALFARATVRALAAASEADDPVAYAARLAADAALADDLDASRLEPADPTGPLLLTGGTGFLGSHLLRELLDHTDRPIHCLVRAADPEEGLRRLRRSLERYELAHDDLADRVTALPGDLARPRLGLDEADFAALAGQLSAIVHNGALVNHLATYEQLRTANVGGTRELLRLASTARAVPVHLVSTLDAVLGADRSGVVTERSELAADEVNRHGYVASKWVAEQLVRRAGERGLPVAVYRPGLVGASARTGLIAADDSLWTMVRAAALLGIAPAVPPGAAVSLAPVDYVARALAALVTGGVPAGERYHLVNTEPTPVAEILHGLERLGYALRTVTPDEAQQVLAARLAAGGAPGDDLARAALLVGNYADLDSGVGDLVLDDTATRRALADTGITCPAVDAAVIDRCLLRFREAGLLPQPSPAAG